MPDSAQFRLFVAVTVPEGVKANMQKTQAELRRVVPQCSVRWARREQFHLTLRFLGDVEAPRVVAWGGLHDEAEQLPLLQQTVEAATEGFTTEKKEERFTGHITLARIKGIKRPEAEALGQAAFGMAD